MQIIEKEIDDLIPAEYNPRELTVKQHKNIKESIHKFGVVDPIIVNVNKERMNVVIGGHQRLAICKELGHHYVPCIELDLSIDQEKELNIRLNKNVGQWNIEDLANNFDVKDLKEWGFDSKELHFADLEKEISTDTEPKETKYELVIQVDSYDIQDNLFKEFLERGLMCRKK